VGVTREPVVESDGEAEGHGEAESYGEGGHPPVEGCGDGDGEVDGYGGGRRRFRRPRTNDTRGPRRALSQLWPAAHEGAIRSLVEEQTPLLHRRSL
jgi:hypothetical protein